MPAKKPARRGVARRTVDAVRRAVAGTLNREVDVAVERMEGGRWAVKLMEDGRTTAPIRIESWEMDAMYKVALLPAHKRGIFFRHYAMLQGRP